ncbi:hypothetical protein FJ651_00165 [Paucihalobacter ruber]|uniref:Uncharacterized protein n=1 Tax=Paucihalobacter ruber TaxID=2567861 RepID=A0A506PNU9_9FLAO|nr:DUF6090 family protein [Paucihalobacter ruber]TPV35371.1 hypothetical protein FJ651_00165 [Paucihalobacter ruber]
MIKFFRNIRQKLLAADKTANYFKYAIGEVVLVVVGILLALQINTWNDNRKYANDKIEFLNGIKNELKLDLKFADNLIIRYQKQLSYFNMVDTTYHLHDLDIVPLADSSDVLDYRKLMEKPLSFKAYNATYQSFMAYGSTKIIRNKELLISLQSYYTRIHELNSSLYGTIEKVESELNWNRAYEKKYKPYKTIKDLNDKQFIAELNYFFDSIHSYLALLFYVKDKSNELIDQIDKELNNKH